MLTEFCFCVRIWRNDEVGTELSKLRRGVDRAGEGGAEGRARGLRSTRENESPPDRKNAIEIRRGEAL